MLAECIDRFRQGSCASCDRREACPFGWWEELSDRLADRRRDDSPARLPGRGRPFLALLGGVVQAAAKQAVQRPSPFRRKVEQAIEPLLGQGEVRIDLVARGLGLSRQTLYRRLKAEGVTFAELLDELRRRLALRYIRQDGLSVKETAYRLGFSDPAAFSRAFKRWTGASPRGR